MKEELRKAINDYCSLLPNLNGGVNPHDDKRLHIIAYQAFVTEEDKNNIQTCIIEELKINEILQNPTDKLLTEFAEKCIVRIDNIKYTLKHLKELKLLKI